MVDGRVGDHSKGMGRTTARARRSILRFRFAFELFWLNYYYSWDVPFAVYGGHGGYSIFVAFLVRESRGKLTIIFISISVSIYSVLEKDGI